MGPSGSLVIRPRRCGGVRQIGHSACLRSETHVPRRAASRADANAARAGRTRSTPRGPHLRAVGARPADVEPRLEPGRLHPRPVGIRTQGARCPTVPVDWIRAAFGAVRSRSRPREIVTTSSPTISPESPTGASQPKPITGPFEAGQPLSATDMPPIATLSPPFQAGLRQLAAGRGRSLPVCDRSWTVEGRLPPVRHHLRRVRHRFRVVRHRFRAVRHRLRPIARPFDVGTPCFGGLRIDSGACDPHVRASTTRSNDATQLRNR